MESPLEQFSLKEVITSAHSKNSNSSGFNPILQNFYNTSCERIVSKTVCGNFLIFCSSSFTNNFMVKNSFSEPKNKRKLNISRPIYFEEISTQCFVGLICTNKREGLFYGKCFFQGLGAFFTTAARLIWASLISTKNNFILILKGAYLMLI